MLSLKELIRCMHWTLYIWILAQPSGKHYGEAGFLSNDKANNNPLKNSREVKTKRELN